MTSPLRRRFSWRPRDQLQVKRSSRIDSLRALVALRALIYMQFAESSLPLPRAPVHAQQPFIVRSADQPRLLRPFRASGWVTVPGPIDTRVLPSLTAGRPLFDVFGVRLVVLGLLGGSVAQRRRESSWQSTAGTAECRADHLHPSDGLLTPSAHRSRASAPTARPARIHPWTHLSMVSLRGYRPRCRCGRSRPHTCETRHLVN
jgi:hypothetical protein